MRKKALLAGAISSFEGPWVNLESGEWLVEPSPDISLDIVNALFETAGSIVSIPGPARIRAIVHQDYNGPGIFLVAKQISNGDSS